jgi:hypothetical protein
MSYKNRSSNTGKSENDGRSQIMRQRTHTDQISRSGVSERAFLGSMPLIEMIGNLQNH